MMRGVVPSLEKHHKVRILDEDGRELPTGETGQVYLKPPDSDRFVYHKAPEKTAAGRRGAFFTMGDMGRLDADGYLYLTGRTADTVISGGVNIYPAEIDAVLAAHPAVKEAACVGVPSQSWGEEVKAVVQLNEGFAGDAALAAELAALCREKIADYKCPKSFDFVEEMPRSAVGKVLRRELRDRYWPAQDKA
jgi:long-chain acyl-CoA synthetase